MGLDESQLNGMTRRPIESGDDWRAKTTAAERQPDVGRTWNGRRLDVGRTSVGRGTDVDSFQCPRLSEYNVRISQQDLRTLQQAVRTPQSGGDHNVPLKVNR